MQAVFDVLGPIADDDRQVVGALGVRGRGAADHAGGVADQIGRQACAAETIGRSLAALGLELGGECLADPGRRQGGGHQAEPARLRSGPLSSLLLAQQVDPAQLARGAGDVGIVRCAGRGLRGDSDGLGQPALPVAGEGEVVQRARRERFERGRGRGAQVFAGGGGVVGQQQAAEVVVGGVEAGFVEQQFLEPGAGGDGIRVGGGIERLQPLPGVVVDRRGADGADQ